VACAVELEIDSNWLDAASGGYVLADDPITITRGADSQSVKASPGLCELTLYDPDKSGRWSNDVPGAPYYGKLGRNTPIRVSVDGDVRFVGEISEWNPDWELGDAKVRVPIRAAGILRRLTQGARGLLLPIERSIRATNPEAYWTLGDAEGATYALPTTGNARLTVSNGTVEFGAFDDLRSGYTTPDTSAGALTGVVSGVSATAFHWEFFARQDVYDGSVAFRLYAGSSATHAIFRIVLQKSGSDPAELFFGDLAGNTTNFITASTLRSDFLESWNHYAVTAEQNGASVDVDFYINGELVGSSSDTGTLEAPNLVLLGHNIGTPTSAAHIAVGSGVSFGVSADTLDDYAGETAGRRIERLCLEEGVAFVGVGDLDDTAPMGPQTTETLVENLEAAAVADQGVLFETRTALGLTYRTRVSMYNQVGPVLDYSAGHIAPPLKSATDVTFAHNDVTVSRPGGSSARSTLTVATDPYHTLTTQPPPNGIGTYDTGAVEANVEADSQLQPLADWLRHLGTWGERRYPSLTVELAAPDLAADPDLIDEITALDTGDQLRLDGLPAWLPPGQVALHVRGSTEVIGTHTRSITWNLAPGWPWEVWVMDTGGSTLVVARDTDDTSLKLATSVGPAWSTSAEPYYLQIAGEAVKVTAMTTDTVAHIATGAASYADNASVTPALPAGITPDVGQLLVILAAGRTQGTHLPQEPAGWTTIVDSNNFKLFARYYVTGDVAPAITFTGGAAGSTTGAQMAAFSGLSMELDITPLYPDGWVSSSNGSAANIAYPAYLNRRTNSAMLIAGHKLDDWTSVATIAGTSEIGDSSSTSGNDMGLVWDLYNPGTPTTVVAGSFTVTGGASAASEGIVVGLRPLQTATVQRGVNGASVTMAAGETVNGWRLGVLGL
jgi:hypothetical protein